MRHVLGGLRAKALSAVYRRELQVPDREPTVSFTFDDFPRSALLVGGSILRSYEAHGTYYASMGMMNQRNRLGEHFNREDLAALLQDGHELGSHTFSHLSCRAAGLREFEADAKKGERAVERVAGSPGAHSFSYPYGHANWRAKQRIGECFSSCRGIVPGINEWPVDLNLLRANSLYSGSFDAGMMGRLFDANEKARGWMICYTHDVSETPSAFGCTPREFESVVRMAVERRVRIMPVGDVVGVGGVVTAIAR